MSTWRRTSLAEGIYDELISDWLDHRLAELPPPLEAVRSHLAASEKIAAPMATMIREALELAFAEIGDAPDTTLDLARELLGVLQRFAPKSLSRPDELRVRPERLHAIVAPPANRPRPPRGGLHASSLIINTAGENLLDHLQSEFESADSVDLLCSFVRLSGFERLRPAIERHCSTRGRVLRVLTTTYMGASEAKAIERMAALPNVRIKVSYDEQMTRLHAKAWIFRRRSGYSTAFVGSSNLSHSAQTEGLEWNVRLAEADQSTMFERMKETFEQYWADDYQFEPYDVRRVEHAERLRRALSPSRHGEAAPGVLFELTPKDFQREILDELSEARRLDRHRNLLVAATGTGKTVMAALDYRRLREAGGRCVPGC